jgi:nucleoid DNA-binding protein
MNKIDIIEHIARSADISKAAAGRALEARLTKLVAEDDRRVEVMLSTEQFKEKTVAAEDKGGK